MRRRSPIRHQFRARQFAGAADLFPLCSMGARTGAQI
jgi:hypothetical protein